LTVTNDWGSGFTAEVKITNTSSTPISGWTLEFDLAGNIVNLWNGAFTKNATHYTVKNASWNGNLAPGGSATFGFQANYSGGRPNPSNCIFTEGLARLAETLCRRRPAV
jgi:beta-glucosidase